MSGYYKPHSYTPRTKKDVLEWLRVYFTARNKPMKGFAVMPKRQLLAIYYKINKDGEY